MITEFVPPGIRATPERLLCFCRVRDNREELRRDDTIPCPGYLRDSGKKGSSRW